MHDDGQRLQIATGSAVVALRTQKNKLERLGSAPNQTNNVQPRGMEAKNSAPRRQIREAIHEVDLSQEDPSHLTAITTSSVRTPNDAHPSKANKYDLPPTNMQHPQTKDRPEYRACQPRAVRADEDLCPSITKQNTCYITRTLLSRKS